MESELFALLQHTSKTTTFTLSWLFHPVCHLCFSWSTLLPLLIKCVESLIQICVCVCVCSSICVWTQWGMFQSGLSQSKQRSHSALCDELSSSESHFAVCKIWWRACTQGPEDKNSRPAEEDEREGGSSGQWDLNERPPFCSSSALLQP